ncbi:hypothetical protein [Arthrobacter sp. B3I4]|uniref:hypothetical protein n=1 Tax=Arthrobacter sp. B3I4 TaxID=3042267 RepID=UPI0027856ADC|nr:hypothetical protein [Arthrobacter sp. B3I4]MDQ0754587.1 hypothetical protein [Arthrobacter sp. B3I4]
MVRQGNSGATARKPVSPIYRRRRLVVGAILLLVLALTVGGLVALSSAFNAAGPAPTASDSPRQEKPGTTEPASSGSPDASASASPTPSPTSGCDEKLLTVAAATDKAGYGPGENPLLTLKVTNGNQVPCEVNIGTSQMEYVVTSGSDRIFSSRDCQAESSDLVKTIAPGKSETANFPWDRKRSAEGCKLVPAQPAAGTYIFTARLGSKTSPKAVFQLGG